MKSAAVFARLNNRDRLWAEYAGLIWGKDSARIREIAGAIELADVAVKDCLPKPLTLQGLYMGFEDFSDLWVAGEVDPVGFAVAAFDYLAREVTQEVGLASAENWCQMVHIYGVAVIDPMFAIVEDLLGSIEIQYRRSRGDDEDAEPDSVYGPLDATGAAFDEAYIEQCDPDDVHATLISIAAVDTGLLEDLKELVRARDNAARRALRGELIP